MSIFMFKRSTQKGIHKSQFQGQSHQGQNLYAYGVWKGLVNIHKHAKYQIDTSNNFEEISISMFKRSMQKVNISHHWHVKFTGVNLFLCAWKCLINIHKHTKISNQYLKGPRRYEHIFVQKVNEKSKCKLQFKGQGHKVTIFAHMERSCQYTHAYKISKQYLKGLRRYEHLLEKPKGKHFYEKR